MGNSSNMASASDAQVDSLERMANQMGAGVRMRIRITQDAFDDAVKETMDDFEMEFDEAVQETIEQFQTQGVDLGGLRLDDPAARAEGGKAIHNACVAIRELTAKVDAGDTPVADVKSELLEAFKKLDAEAIDEEKRNEACSHGVVAGLGGATGYGDADVVKSALQSLTNLLQTYSAREAVSQSTVNLIVSSIRMLPEVTIDAFKALAAACLRDEPNKSRVEAADERYTAINQVIAGDDRDAAVAACDLVRRLVLRDDTREMMDNCFNRSKSLKNFGTLAIIAKVFTKYQEDMEAMPIILHTLAATCLRQENNDVLESNNMVEISVGLLQKHMDNQPVAENIISMIAALAQSDVSKRVIGQGNGLPLLLTALDKYRSSGKVVLRCLKGLGQLLLRTPDTTTRMHELGGVVLALDVARRFTCIKASRKAQAANAKIQSAPCLLLRNAVSHNKELIKPILEEGTEEQLRLESVHPDLNETVFLTLKELQCAVKLKEEWTGAHGDIFKQDTGEEASSDMKDFLSEYRNEAAEGVIRQAGMQDDCDVATMPKMGKTNTSDQPQISECNEGCCH